MTEFSIELAAEQIVDSRSRSYFSEVLTSFINGSYRSAVVMLWSVAIADLVYKLQALQELYNDPTASSLLTELSTKQKANPTSPEWEPYLVDEISKRTNLLDIADTQHLINLQKLRHLSAHPVISSSNLLFSPNKETTRALIRNTLEAVLLKPPILSKKIVTELVQDIAAKQSLLPDDQSLKQYLDAKYFRNLQPSVENELITALWKFCFRISNAETDANRQINRRTLTLLYQRNRTAFRLLVEHNKDSFSVVSEKSDPLTSLIDFLTDCPALYSVLTETAKVPLGSHAKSDVNLFCRATFISGSVKSHVEQLSDYPYKQLRDLTDENWSMLLSRGREENVLPKVFAIGVKVYVNSGAFDTADSNFARFISPIIDELDEKNMRDLLEGININKQTYWRGRARYDHKLIDARIATIGTIDKSEYENFCEYLPTNE